MRHNAVQNIAALVSLATYPHREVSKRTVHSDTCGRSRAAAETGGAACLVSDARRRSAPVPLSGGYQLREVQWRARQPLQQSHQHRVQSAGLAAHHAPSQHCRIQHKRTCKTNSYLQVSVAVLGNTIPLLGDCKPGYS